MHTKFFVVKPEGKRPLGRLRSRWECNAEMSLLEIIWKVVWDLAMCLRVATSGTLLPTYETHLSLRKIWGDFLASWGTKRSQSVLLFIDLAALCHPSVDLAALCHPSVDFSFH